MHDSPITFLPRPSCGCQSCLFCHALIFWRIVFWSGLTRESLNSKFEAKLTWVAKPESLIALGRCHTHEPVGLFWLLLSRNQTSFSNLHTLSTSLSTSQTIALCGCGVWGGQLLSRTGMAGCCARVIHLYALYITLWNSVKVD